MTAECSLQLWTYLYSEHGASLDLPNHKLCMELNCLNTEYSTSELEA